MSSGDLILLHPPRLIRFPKEAEISLLCSGCSKGEGEKPFLLLKRNPVRDKVCKQVPLSRSGGGAASHGCLHEACHVGKRGDVPPLGLLKAGNSQ